MRIVYAGTPEFAVPALSALIESDHDIVAVYTQPDRPAGRGRRLQSSPVKLLAAEHGLTVMQPQSLKDAAAVAALRDLAPDLMVVAAYGLILPGEVLHLPRLGCVNIHASLLPRWRGAAPIQRAILAGDRQTGITLMQMDEGLDTGAMLAISKIDLDRHITSADLHDHLKQLGARLLLDNLDALVAGELAATPQDDTLACYAPKLTKAEAEIDWTKTAEILHREVRAFNPWPVSHTSLHGRIIKLWSADLLDAHTDVAPGKVLTHDGQGIQVSCGVGSLLVREIQFAGKKRLTAGQLLTSTNLTDEVLGT